ncbi:hypothetical protein HDV05_005428 [Chytridiales sp. JEL 0842]|nr:hypothetical protein HDV05_005428 [Chytridiales sp. JEL 0842]
MRSLVTPLLTLVSLTLTLLLSTIPHRTSAALQYTGVNQAGLEFGISIFGPTQPLPGQKDWQYFEPNPASLLHASKTYANLFRLPLAWERLQPTLRGDLSSEHVGYINDVLKVCRQVNATLVLDVHNYARYYGNLIGSDKVSNEDFNDLWVRLARLYRNDPLVVFGIMNEPHTMSRRQWFTTAQSAINAIREKAQATNIIAVPGTCWTGAHSWEKPNCDQGGPGDTSTNAEWALKITDPAKNLVWEFHQYFDMDRSGTNSLCTVLDAEEVLGAATRWLRRNGLKGFLGEFAGTTSGECMQALESALAYMDKNDDVWWGHAFWSAGRAWGGYMYSIESTRREEDKPQMRLLEKYKFGPPSNKPPPSTTTTVPPPRPTTTTKTTIPTSTTSPKILLHVQPSFSTLQCISSTLHASFQLSSLALSYPPSQTLYPLQQRLGLPLLKATFTTKQPSTTTTAAAVRLSVRGNFYNIDPRMSGVQGGDGASASFLFKLTENGSTVGFFGDFGVPCGSLAGVNGEEVFEVEFEGGEIRDAVGLPPGLPAGVVNGEVGVVVETRGMQRR